MRSPTARALNAGLAKAYKEFVSEEADARGLNVTDFSDSIEWRSQCQ
jgi:hypothetical protein